MTDEAGSATSSLLLTWHEAGSGPADSAGAPRRAAPEPVTCGVPWPQGVLARTADLVLRSADGRTLPLQARALDRWPDGSVRWTLTDFRLDSAVGPYRLSVEARGVAGPGSPGDNGMVTSRSRTAVTVDTGAAVFVVGVGEDFPFRSVEIDGRTALDVSRSGLRATDELEDRYVLRTERLEIIDEGPVRVCLRLEGALVSELVDPMADVVAEIHLYAGSAAVRCDLAVTNPRAASHPGGLWTLGEGGAVFFEDLALELALPVPDREWTETTPTVRCSVEEGAALVRESLPLAVYQDSSGGENWRSTNHLDRRGELQQRFRGYRSRSGETETSGLRASPVVELERGASRLVVCCEGFWENFPKALSAGRDSVTVGLFPRRSGILHELQGGERKTHTVRFHLGDAVTTEALLGWLRRPLVVRADPSWYATASAVPYLVTEDDDPNRACQDLVDAGMEGSSSFFVKREVVDEYGWRHFGELYADHEAVRVKDGPPLVSHYNNQYDAIAGFAAHYMRSGDPRWFRLLDDLARHVADIDLYHTDYDKSAYSRGHFWHTVHYIDAGLATHRSYPRAEGVVGGGPSSGHLYTTGLMLHHFLTGSPASRDAVIQLGQYVIDADDGRKTVFRFLDRGPTGHVTLSAWDEYHGPGRSAANSLNALLDAHRLTGESRFLAKAEELIRRSIHPEDDLEARRLTYVEGRWFYTMFLARLGKYLDHKALLGQNDSMYAYAREALLHYTAWALANEYPYLEKPEILEFPTETWAAQDMRKSEIFRIAARHTEGEESRRYLDKARWFFDVSVRQLEEHETRSLCRPLVLMQSLGYGQAWTDRHPEDRAPRPVASWRELGPPRAFVPQKARAKRNALWLSAAGLLGLGALALLRWVL